MANDEPWVGRAVRLRRLAKEWSLERLRLELARQRIRVDRSTIMRWERGRIPTNHRNVARALGRVFGCSALAFYRDPFITFQNDPDHGEDG